MLFALTDTAILMSSIQCESKKIPPRVPDIFAFFSQTVENL